MVKSDISGQIHDSVSVPNKGGTGTTYAEAKWYRYHPKWYRYQDKVVPIPRQSGTGTNFQNMIGTSTNPSGTGTDRPPS